MLTLSDPPAYCLNLRPGVLQVRRRFDGCVSEQWFGGLSIVSAFSRLSHLCCPHVLDIMIVQPTKE